MPPRSSKPAAAFVGIHNENEFYSHHYLSEIFRRDISATIETWRKDAADEDKPPYERLRALAGEYRRRRAEYQRERRPESRLKLQRDWLRKILYPLGHGWHPGDHLLDDGNPLPALGADGFRDGCGTTLRARRARHGGAKATTRSPCARTRRSSTGRRRRRRNCWTRPGTT